MENQNPFKDSVFGWRLIFKMLPTRDQQVSRGIIHDGHSKVCVFCFSEEEDLTHTILKYSFSIKIWDIILDWIYEDIDQ